MSTIKEILIPDIGSSSEVEVIEVLISEGDSIAEDDSIITLESEKASMEIPSPESGIVKKVKIKVGDKVSQGVPILDLEISGEAAETKQPEQATTQQATKASVLPETITSSTAPLTQTISTSAPAVSQPAQATGPVYASPTVRRLAREFGVDLTRVPGSGRKNRILKEDIQAYVKSALQAGVGAAASGSSGTGIGLNILPPPDIDFSQFGPIESKPLNKIKRFTGLNLHRNWVSIPHVTQFDEADITLLEAFRQEQKDAAKAKGIRLTPLAFVMKAVLATLREFPNFNASLDAKGENLIVKNYYNIGVAVDTPNGLVVPVIRDVDNKGLMDLAKELSEVSEKAREKGLSPKDMQGSTFTISSLGGIGGTAFTPIVNMPDVAILGVSKAMQKPVYDGKKFVPRLMLPLSLSYDHRVVDGAEGARFTQYLAKCLSDIRKLLL